MRTWQKFFKTKLRELGQRGTVYDIGGGAKPRRDFFSSYVVVDVNPVYKPDVIADIQALPFEDNSIDAILCLSVLEHIEYPQKAANELFRVLKPGGKILLSLPCMWPYHANENYRDYWRFTKDGIQTMFSKFSKMEIMRGGGYFSAATHFIPSYTGIDRLIRPLAQYLDDILHLGKSITTEYFVFLEK